MRTGATHPAICLQLRSSCTEIMRQIHCFFAHQHCGQTVCGTCKRDLKDVDIPVCADVHMVLTRNMNAKRLARMVLKPVVAGVSAVLFDFRTDSQTYSFCFPMLAGMQWRDVPFVFDRATVLGLFPTGMDNELVICPNPEYIMQVLASLLNLPLQSFALLWSLQLHPAAGACGCMFASCLSGSMLQVPLCLFCVQDTDLICILRSSKLRPDDIVPDIARGAPNQGAWRPPNAEDSGDDVLLAPTSTPVDSLPDRNTTSMQRSGSGSGGLRLAAL